MNEWLVVAIGIITYASRAAALVFLPRPTPRVEEILERMPAPIFAGLAVLTLIDADGSLAGGPALLAALGALAMTPKRSLPICLAGGLAGYLVGQLLLQGG
ncbi:MAG: AzlD domain-containing protein [Chloroflexota bacterium]|nr:AzlD domain-containing protein [Chloroflexota bacterium]